MNKLNKLQFTVRTQDQNFESRLFHFIRTQDLTQTSAEDNSYSFALDIMSDLHVLYGQQACFPKLSDIVESQNRDFLHLHVNGTQYSFSFEKIVELHEFSKKSGFEGDIDLLYIAFEHMYSDQHLIQRKQTIVKSTIDFLKREGLLAMTTIEGITFESDLQDPAMVNAMKDMINGADDTEADVKGNIYTGTIAHYKAYLKAPQKLIDIYYEAKGEATKDLKGLDENETCKILKEVVKKQFMQVKKLLIKKDTYGYYIHADPSCLRVWNKPVDIAENVSIEFKPVFVESQNYYGIYNPMKIRFAAKLDNTKKIVDEEFYDRLDEDERAGYEVTPTQDIYFQKVHEVEVSSAGKVAYILEINDWHATDGQVYTLASSVDDLVNYIDAVPKFPNVPQKFTMDTITGSLTKLLS